MSYNPITENLSFNYQDAAITSNVTLDSWGKQLYDVIATSGNIVITLPPNPLGSNTVEMGSVFFRRLDTTAANTVTVVAVINGVQQNILLPIGTDVVHWFVSVFDGGFGSTTFYFQQSSAAVSNSTRVATYPVYTVATTNQNVAATDYINKTINGFTLYPNASLLLKSQSTAVENGVYVVQNNGGIARRSDFALGVNVKNYLVVTTNGTLSNRMYQVVNGVDQNLPVISGYDSIAVLDYLIGKDVFYEYGYESFWQVLDSDYTADPMDTIILVNLLSGVNRTLTLPPLASLLNNVTTNKLKLYQIIKIAPSGVLSITCSGGDTFGDGTTSISLQKNGDTIYLTGLISPTQSFWLIG